ncbi:hypothetical protein MASR2M15_02380 [Anaerolineales bacterium]
MIRLTLIVISFFLSQTLLFAQEETAPVLETTCPTLIQEAFTATKLICGDMEENTLCYGNGIMTATPVSENLAFNFQNPGDIVNLNDLSQLELRSTGTESNVWTSALLNAYMPLQSDNTSTAFIAAFGNLSLQNLSTAQASASIPVQVGTVLSSGGMNVRSAPDGGANLIWQLKSGEEIIVTGRNANDSWLRMEIPGAYGGVGWVYRLYVGLDGDISKLQVVDVNSPAPQVDQSDGKVFDEMRLNTVAIDPTCADSPDSGLLIQSGSGSSEDIIFQLNDATIALNGTIFISAHSNEPLRIHGLEGQATITALDASETLRSGQLIEINSDENGLAASVPSSPQASSITSTFPLDLLPRPFLILEASTESQTIGSADPEVVTGIVLETVSDAAATLTPVESQSTPEAEVTSEASPEATALTTSPQTPMTASLKSSSFGEICGKPTFERSLTSDTSQPYLSLGANWTAQPTTKIKLSVSGGQFRSEFGDYIRLQTVDGLILAQSANKTELTYTADETVKFLILLSAAQGDKLSLTIQCTE